MRALAFTVLIGSLGSLGCLGIKPVGPMAKMMNEEAPPTNPAPGVTVTAAKDAPAGPVIQQAPPPPLPSLKVTPGEVTESNYQDAMRRLIEEIEADRKAMESMPRYVEVSVVK
jgi:hypothetical protein